MAGSTPAPARPPVTIELPALHPSQHAIAQALAAYRPGTRRGVRFGVLAAGRRWGKTVLGVVLCLIVALRGGRAWWVSADYKRAKEGWLVLVEIARHLPGVRIKESDLTIEITVPGGRRGTVEVRSADDPEQLRGAGLDFVVLDEAAFMLVKAWTHSLRPALSDRRGGALFISTPNGKGWFWRLGARRDVDKTAWEDPAAALDGWRHWTFPSWDNPHLAEDEIASARADSHPEVFAQEWGAQFLDLALVKPFRAEWFLDYEALPPIASLFTVIGVDPAISKRDEACMTALVAAGVPVTGPQRTTAHVLDAVEGHWSPYETADRLLAWIKAYRPRRICIEDVAYQRALKDIVEKEASDRGIHLPAIELVKPELDKLRRALGVSGRVESGAVLFGPGQGTLKRALLSVPEDVKGWDLTDAFGLALGGLPKRQSERMPLQAPERLPSERRAEGYAVKPAHVRHQPVVPGLTPHGVWRSTLPGRTRDPRRRARSYGAPIHGRAPGLPIPYDIRPR